MFPYASLINVKGKQKSYQLLFTEASVVKLRLECIPMEE